MIQIKAVIYLTNHLLIYDKSEFIQFSQLCKMYSKLLASTQCNTFRFVKIPKNVKIQY